MPYTVFPLHGIRADGTCACHEGAACKSKPGKHPSVAWSQLAPGEQKFGLDGHGIVTGAKSGIFVIDTDTDEADARFRSSCEIEGFDPDSTYVVKTPKGASTRHYYFAHPGHPVRTSVGELLALETDALDLKTGKRNSKIDVRGDGGMVVMAGSPHASGGTYVAENKNPPRVAPSFLLAWEGLKGSTRAEGENAPIPVTDIPIEVGPNAGRSVLDVRRELGEKACLEMPPAVDGDNGSLALWNICVHLVRDLELPLDVVWELVTGKYNARCEPPWSPKEIEHKILDARDKSDRPPGGAMGLDLSALTAGLLPAPIITADGHTYECALDSVTAIKPSKTTARNVSNILAAHPSWEGVFAFDAFRERIVCKRRPPIAMPGLENGNLDESDVFAVRVWFETIGGYVVSKDVVWDAINAVARMRSFHPLRDYLDGLESGAGAIDGLCEALGIEDAFERVYVRRFLVGAAARVYAPGCKLDNMLVLFGPPGLKKSTTVLALFGKEWVSQNLADISDEKKTGEVLAGKWAVELAELKDVLAAGNETVAAFITRTSERFRAAYARGNAVDRDRTAVLVASTNENDILRNSTGADARRFWIVKPAGRADGKIDIPWITSNRDRVWGEAVAAMRAGECYWLEGEEERAHLERMKAHEETDVWHEAIEDFVTGRTVVTSEDVYRHLDIPVEKLDRRVKLRVVDTMRRLGCKPDIIGKYRRRVWLVPEVLSKEEPTPEEAAKRVSADVAAKLTRN